MRKPLSVAFLAALMVCGFALACTTHVSGMPTPSVPEFTLEVVHRSYDHPAIYKIDPYTGDNVTIVPAKHEETTEIVVAIKNQPFTPYKDSNGTWIELYYNVQTKGPYSDSWNTVSYMYDIGWLKQSNSDYTQQSYMANDYSPNAKVDFRAEAIGYFKESSSSILNRYELIFEGETSGWSDTQTVTISENQPPTSSPATPTPTPHQTQQTEPTTIIGVAIVAVILGAGLGLLVYLIKRK